MFVSVRWQPYHGISGRSIPVWTGSLVEISAYHNAPSVFCSRCTSGPELPMQAMAIQLRSYIFIHIYTNDATPRAPADAGVAGHELCVVGGAAR